MKHTALNTETYQKAYHLFRAGVAFRVVDKAGYSKDFIPGSIIYNSNDLRSHFKIAFFADCPFVEIVCVA